MKRFITLMGLGLGLALGAGIIYAFYASEAARLIAVGVGAFLLAAITIGGTALMVNRQWTNALGSQRATHHHRYQVQQPPSIWGTAQAMQRPDLLPAPPLPDVLDINVDVEADEVVA